MKKRKMVTKIFQLITVSILFILSGQLVFQTIFLEKAYLKHKKGSIEKQITALTYQLNQLPQDDVDQTIRKFSQQYGATTGILSLEGIPLVGFNGQVGFMEVVGEQGEKYTIYLTNFMEDKELLEKLVLGSAIKAELLEIVESNNTYYAESITIGGERFVPRAVEVMRASTVANRSINATALDSSQHIILSEVKPLTKRMIVEGSVKNLYIPGEELFGNGYRESKIIEEVNNFLYHGRKANQALEMNKPIIYESIDTYVGIKNIMAIVPVVSGNEIKFLASITSLEQVEEAIRIMNYYTFGIFLLGLLAAILFAYWYARKWTKPLLAIKEVTSHITQLDFSIQCKIESGDELGELGENINQMAFKLQTTLDTLQKDMALKEKRNEERKQFIIDVSHELKTPLTVLKATCCGFLDDLYESKDKVYVENMLYQIDTMSELVQQLLMTVRLDKEALKEEIFDLSNSILKIHAGVKVLGVEKKLRITLDLEESMVYGERKQIETVIRNFYNNAIFYSKEEAAIFIKIEKIEHWWICSIENTGAWIEEEKLEKVWEPFYRIDESRNKSLGGSGLGLYIVRKVIEKHNGGYGIENTKYGVKAWFSLLAVEEN